MNEITGPSTGGDLESKRERLTWVYLLTPPVAWTVYFMLVYLLVEAVCKLERGEAAVLPVTLIFTLITLLLIGYTSYRAYRQQQDQQQDFASFGSITLGLLFILLTLGVGLTVFVLRPC
jgi:integral membrane sensor domain MASE1